jgi:hypothetical protein
MACNQSDTWEWSANPAQRLGANIRCGVTKGVRELQTSEQVQTGVRGLRGFINKLGSGGHVPSLND